MHIAAESLLTTPEPTPLSGEAHMQTWDGSELFYRYWLPARPCTRALILFHGGHEHSGRFQELVEQLELKDFAIFAWDARGHGFSPGSRGFARHFLDYVRDAEAFVRHLSDEYRIPLEEMALIGHSVGSVIAATWVNDYAPPIRAMVLGSPALKIKLYVPAALTGLRLLQRLRPDAHISSYVKPGMLTHDKAEAAARRADPLISPRIAVRVLTSLFDTAERLIDSANGIRVPTLILSAGRDRVVQQAAQRRLFDNLGSREKVFKNLPGFYHEIFHERDRHIPIAAAREFITRQFTRTPTRMVQIGAGAYTGACNQDRYSQLQQPLPLLSPARWKFGASRFGLKTLGRLSEGVRLGWESGFDSGRTLDYVYRNQARGLGPLGRLIDRHYLDSAGWVGIRQRRLHLERQLNRAIDALRTPEKAVHLVDMAGGPGRYLIEVMRQRQDPAISAVCRDRDLEGLAEGRELARASGVTRLLYEPGDAFDPDSIATLSPRPDIVIVSGLYELFDDNARVLRSLRAIHRQMRPGGRLIYTNQPHHPQLELIARTLINRDGDPWVMRLRPQSEINDLVRQAGFTPQSQLQDDDGIFTITSALREA
ncbi:bifunctional alpha/beta hydrolase/class I SAM-dependent methyltransferase [Sedimenticola hydrogenitrophicus]|uniref:bifunctional alpha/beta hydrolase/class I SAM-dependent methyltransferase n=1 Tax=Sedimenticola hydrogenitrophicus TaxID=2967975 RepID=UPI0023B091FA|nr:bifunctional alpha/beta hydrolase/class I SAM-dependent methyltransferase [Sedimenticola hydrogenitrophicus]